MAGPSADLQKAVRNALAADAAVAAIVGARILDGRPDGELFPCLTFGPSDATFDDMDGVAGRIETLQIDCWVRDGQRLWPARNLVDAVREALHLKALTLDTHALANLQVTALRVFMDPDGLTGHGVVTVEAVIEER